MMFAGLRSRWITPREWAYSTALQTSMNRRSSRRSSSDRRPGSVLQRLVGVEAVDGLLERFAADEPHGVVGAAVGVGAQAVDGDDAGVLQAAGDLGLDEEPPAAGRVVGVLLEDLLERDLAVQFAVEGHEDGAEPAAGVRAEDAEPLSIGGGRADGVIGGAVGIDRAVVLGRTAARTDAVKRRPDVGIAQSGQALARADLPAGTAARLCSTSPPWASMCTAARASTAARRAALRCPRAMRWSARERDLSQVQAWNAATSCACWIKPFCRASKPKRRWRSAATAAMKSPLSARPRPTGPATAAEPGRGGRRIGRIIARGFAASIPAGPISRLS